MAHLPRKEIKEALDAIAPEKPTCIACRGVLFSETRMQCGKACGHCYRAYLDGRWDGRGYSEQRETLRIEATQRSTA